jgi:septum formation protein
MRGLILASQSPRRHELLRLLGLPFVGRVSAVAEDRREDELPVEYARRLSREKAGAVAASVDGGSLILACDTVVVDGEDVLGKPVDSAEAAAILKRLAGRDHHVYTAATLLDTADGRAMTELADSPVTMRPYTNREVADYVATGDPFDKAGAYAIQHEGFHPVERFTHCFANVMGLPLCHVTRMLRAFGVEPGADVPAACQAHIGYDCPVYEAILNGGE